MSIQQCNVCDSALGSPIYAPTSGDSLTSLCKLHPGHTQVFACEGCGHLQSLAIDDIDRYYEDEYDILIGSEEEDQIYEVRDGAPVYRTQHQLATLLSKLAFSSSLRLLDYGCAKSSIMRLMRSQRPDLDIHLFDVSERYIPFWRQFVGSSKWAIKDIKTEWENSFDVVTSFFSLEHIGSPAGALQSVTRLLKPGGVFYCVVPYVLTNPGDLIVVDHVNHFTRPSIIRLLESAGLKVRGIDDKVHSGALVAIAEKSGTGPTPAFPSPQLDRKHALDEARKTAHFWSAAANRVRAFEESIADEPAFGIYGAGFYGTFIAANLYRRERIACFLDQNPYLQGKSVAGKEVVAPDTLPNNVRSLFVGLNPIHARNIIANIPALAARNLRCFYL